MNETMKKLAAPFSPTLIHWRVGATNGDKTKGIALAYLNARDVMERLDDAVGPENWQARYPFPGCCEISIRRRALIGDAEAQKVASPDEWITKANGAGQSDIEGEKGQYSDAFKRAAVLWGVGRYLYDLPNVWFAIESRGKSHVFTKEAQAEMTERLDKWQKRITQQEKVA